MEWRTWLRDKLLAESSILELVPEELIFASGSMEGRSSIKPYVVIRIGEESPGPFPGSRRLFGVVWVHDEPGTYLNIGAILSACRQALVGGVATKTDAIGCRWLGDSGDQADEELGTITRYATFELVGMEIE